MAISGGAPCYGPSNHGSGPISRVDLIGFGVVPCYGPSNDLFEGSGSTLGGSKMDLQMDHPEEVLRRYPWLWPIVWSRRVQKGVPKWSILGVWMVDLGVWRHLEGSEMTYLDHLEHPRA